MQKKISYIVVLLLFLSIISKVWAETDEAKVDASFIIGTVQVYAERGDLTELAKYMSGHFRYSFGGNNSKDEAISFYREHPEILKEMARIIAQGCRLTLFNEQQYYVCPPQAADTEVIYLNYRAGFRKQANNAWVFEYFVTGD